MRNHLIAAAVILLLASCTNNTASTVDPKVKGEEISVKNDTVTKKDLSNVPVSDAATIMGRKQVPILCYHHIRYPKPGKKLDDYSVTPEGFKEQLKALNDSGYKTVTPDQLYDYLTKGAPIPEKPVMLTYDDTDDEQFTIAKAEMDKYGFKGVYFIMTISIGRPRYMTKEQIRQLADEGHTIASHTWRHDRVDRYLTTPHFDKGLNKQVDNDWDMQLIETRKKLQEITGKPIEYFAYPFGIWSEAGIPEIAKRGYKLAFQLSTKRDPENPLYTVRRMVVAPEWTAAGMIRVMKNSFK
jgi:peptidoglycan/xylan/chitin deacetylase (PgdA/CDA1 family)